MFRTICFLGIAGAGLLFSGDATAAQLLVGAATADITPTDPVALDGQMHLRIAKNADTPITANVLVLESREGDRSLDAAVMVSCDLIVISEQLLEHVRKAVRKRLPDFNQKKMILNATHTHTAPVTLPGVYDIPKTGVMQVDAYCEFAADRIAEAVEKAWKGRAPGGFTWGLGHAAVAVHRRATYADGSAVTYGPTNVPNFRGLEGYEDHDIGSLFFWNGDGKLIAIVVNVSCPAQEVEGTTSINADFWHPVRESLRKRYGSDVCVLGWTGAAGDMSPHLMIGDNPRNSGPEERMRRMRNLSPMEEIARRIVCAVTETYEVVQKDRHSDVVLKHASEMIRVPRRLVTQSEYDEVKKTLATKLTHTAYVWHKSVLDRYERQKKEPTVDRELHVVRLGDVAVCTTCFELFTDYGAQIKARSKAGQTFIVQMAGPHVTYVPTERAVRGG